MTRQILIIAGLILLGATPASGQESTSVAIPQFERMWGRLGSGPGEFNVPRGIATGPDGSVYVSDLVNSRIQKFTPDGVFVRQWGSYGSAPGQFNSVEGVAVDAQGFVYAADELNYRVQKFTNEGEFVLAWGKPGFGPGEFGYYPPPSAPDGPYGVAVAPDGTIYVGDPGGFRVQHFTPDGAFLGTLDGVTRPRGIAVDPYGSVFVAEDWNSHIIKFSPDGQVILSWGGYGCCEGLWRSALDLDTDFQGNVWVVDAGNGLIQVFDNDGRFLIRWGSKGSDPGQFFDAQAVAFGSGGTFFVADTGLNRVEKFAGAVPVRPTTWGAIKSLYR